MIAALVRRAREAARGRDVIVVAENEPQDVRVVEPPSENGFGVDALWNDDFHHTARVALTGCREGYLYGLPGHASGVDLGGEVGLSLPGPALWLAEQAARHADLALPPATFIAFLQNHDQVANTLRGERLHRIADPGIYRALTALLCLAPSTPCSFRARSSVSSPWLYFADHEGDLGRQVRKGRAEFLSQFPSIAAATRHIPDPLDPATFQRCKLNPAERDPQAPLYALHRDLLALRRGGPGISQPATPRAGRRSSTQAFVLRFFGGAAGDRLLCSTSAPTSASIRRPSRCWRHRAAGPGDSAGQSEEPRYGGGRGTAPVVTEAGWYLVGHAAVVLEPAPGGPR